MYSGSNTLYKDQVEDVYILALTLQSDLTTNDFNRICNMLQNMDLWKRLPALHWHFWKSIARFSYLPTQFKKFCGSLVCGLISALICQITERCRLVPMHLLLFAVILCIQECIDLFDQ